MFLLFWHVRASCTSWTKVLEAECRVQIFKTGNTVTSDPPPAPLNTTAKQKAAADKSTVPREYWTRGALEESSGGGLGGFRRSFMAIMAIKLRKKVNWGQLSSAGHSNQ